MSYILEKFRYLLFEALDLSQFNLKKGTKEVNIFVGRLQPFHKIHQKRIEDGNVTDIFLVKGGKSDPKKSPFPFEIQQEMLQAVFGNKVTVHQSKSAFIGELINILRDENKEPVKLFCGTDREASYKDQVRRYSSDLNLKMKVEVFERLDSDISGTAVRKSLINDDFETFKNCMPKQIATKLWFEKLKKYVGE